MVEVKILTPEDILQLCNEAVEYGFEEMCVQVVRQLAERVQRGEQLTNEEFIAVASWELSD